MQCSRVPTTMFCTQHLQKADERKLKGMGANQSSISRIMGDIYGVRSGPVEQPGRCRRCR